MNNEEDDLFPVSALIDNGEDVLVRLDSVMGHFKQTIKMIKAIVEYDRIANTTRCRTLVRIETAKNFTLVKANEDKDAELKRAKEHSDLLQATNTRLLKENTELKLKISGRGVDNDSLQATNTRLLGENAELKQNQMLPAQLSGRETKGDCLAPLKSSQGADTKIRLTKDANQTRHTGAMKYDKGSSKLWGVGKSQTLPDLHLWQTANLGRAKESAKDSKGAKKEQIETSISRNVVSQWSLQFTESTTQNPATVTTIAIPGGATATEAAPEGVGASSPEAASATEAVPTSLTASPTIATSEATVHAHLQNTPNIKIKTVGGAVNQPFLMVEDKGQPSTENKGGEEPKEVIPDVTTVLERSSSQSHIVAHRSEANNPTALTGQKMPDNTVSDTQTTSNKRKRHSMLSSDTDTRTVTSVKQTKHQELLNNLLRFDLDNDSVKVQNITSKLSVVESEQTAIEEREDSEAKDTESFAPDVSTTVTNARQTYQTFLERLLSHNV
jgi:hypothetical protein